MIIVGVDPSNTRTGVSVWNRGALVFSCSYDPWRDDPEDLEVHLVGLKIDKVWIEVPQNGTHKSRGGVQRAGGMAVEKIRGISWFHRTKLRTVPPDAWRKNVLGCLPPEGEAKKSALRWAGGVKPVTCHDEAEAICIGAHGCLLAGYDV